MKQDTERKKGSLIVSGRRYKIRRPPGQNFFLVAYKVRHEINLAEIILTQGCQPPKFLNIDNS